MQVIQQPAPLTDEPEQAATRVVIFGMRSQVFAELLDASREQRYLNFRRATIACGPSVTLYDFPLSGGCEGHQESFFLLRYKRMLTET
jgi:hypothetical protein